MSGTCSAERPAGVLADRFSDATFEAFSRLLSRWRDDKIRGFQLKVKDCRKQIQAIIKSSSQTVSLRQNLEGRISQLRELIRSERKSLVAQADGIRAVRGVEAGRIRPEGMTVWLKSKDREAAVFAGPDGQVEWVNHSFVNEPIIHPATGMINGLIRYRRLTQAIEVLLDEILPATDAPKPPEIPSPQWIDEWKNIDELVEWAFEVKEVPTPEYINRWQDQVAACFLSPLLREEQSLLSELEQVREKEIAREAELRPLEVQLAGAIEGLAAASRLESFEAACRSQWEDIISRNLVNRVEVHPDGQQLIIDTNKVYILCEGLKYELGPYRIVIDAVERYLSAYSLRPNGGYDHPHIMRGIPCFGSAGAEVARSFSAGNLARLVEFTLDLLQSYNPSSAYSRLQNYRRSEL